MDQFIDLIEKKNKTKKVDPNVEKDIKAKLIQGVPATSLIKDHGYARSTVYKVRQGLIDDWEKGMVNQVTGFNPGETTVTTEPIAYPTADLDVPAHNIFYLMFAELQRMNRVLIQISSAVNLMNVNAQAETWKKNFEQSSSHHPIIPDPDAMKKNVAVVMRNMIPEDILKAMPPHLRKAYDGLLSTLAPPNDPVWSDDESKPDPREPMPDRSAMDPFTRLGDTLNRVQKGMTSVEDILYGDKSKKKKKELKTNDWTTPVKKTDWITPPNPVAYPPVNIANTICPGCEKDIPPTLHNISDISLTPDGRTWHKECFHKHLELQQQKAEDEMNKDKK